MLVYPPTLSGFLSHLCGEEAVRESLLSTEEFLSHLCGEEVIAKTLLTTKAGKNLLLAASELPPTQKAAFDNIMKIATKLASSSGSKKGRDTAERVAGTRVSEQDSKSLQSF